MSIASQEIQIVGHGGNPPGQGPFMQITLAVVEGVIREASFETYQCPGAHGCGKAIVELILNQSIAVARGVTREMIVEKVGPLPRHRQIAYSLAILALDDALKQYEKA